MRRCVQKQDELSSKQMPKKKGNVQEEKKSKRGRKQKPFHILSGDRQRKMLCQVEKLIDLLSRKDKQSFVWMLFLRVFGTSVETEQKKYTKLKENVKFFCENYLKYLNRQVSRAASALTMGMSLAEASEITQIPISSLSWGRSRIEKGDLHNCNPSIINLPRISSEEKIWFQDYVHKIAPVTSGTINVRRIPYITYQEFYQVYAVEASMQGHEVFFFVFFFFAFF